LKAALSAAARFVDLGLPWRTHSQFKCVAAERLIIDTAADGCDFLSCSRRSNETAEVYLDRHDFPPGKTDGYVVYMNPGQQHELIEFIAVNKPKSKSAGSIRSLPTSAIRPTRSL
jgi:hypothetical protein